jgi:flagellar biosynthesis/type III secretory pathway protein FliH
MLKQATVIKSSDVQAAIPLAPDDTPTSGTTIVRHAVVRAQEQARAMLAEAEAQATVIRSAALAEATELKRVAVDTGRAQGYAEVMARTVLLNQMEARADERALQRTVSLARLLAERLLGKSVELDEGTVIDLAQRALAEVKGVRQVQLLAHPADVAVLKARLADAEGSFGLMPDAALHRGDFRMVTDVGTIDARLGDRLELLVAKLHDSLKKGA